MYGGSSAWATRLITQTIKNIGTHNLFIDCSFNRPKLHVDIPQTQGIERSLPASICCGFFLHNINLTQRYLVFPKLVNAKHDRLCGSNAEVHCFRIYLPTVFPFASSESRCSAFSLCSIDQGLRAAIFDSVHGWKIDVASTPSLCIAG